MEMSREGAAGRPGGPVPDSTVSNCEGESLVLQGLSHCNTSVMSCITSDDFHYK